jgi:hypothetical protein
LTPFGAPYEALPEQFIHTCSYSHHTHYRTISLRRRLKYLLNHTVPHCSDCANNRHGSSRRLDRDANVRELDLRRRVSHLGISSKLQRRQRLDCDDEWRI